jgi:hypothetical protein
MVFVGIFLFLHYPCLWHVTSYHHYFLFLSQKNLENWLHLIQGKMQSHFMEVYRDLIAPVLNQMNNGFCGDISFSTFFTGGCLVLTSVVWPTLETSLLSLHLFKLFDDTKVEDLLEDNISSVPISTEQKITPHFYLLNTTKDQDIWRWKFRSWIGLKGTTRWRG